MRLELELKLKLGWFGSPGHNYDRIAYLFSKALFNPETLVGLSALGVAATHYLVTAHEP